MISKVCNVLEVSCIEFLEPSIPAVITIENCHKLVSLSLISQLSSNVLLLIGMVLFYWQTIAVYKIFKKLTATVNIELTDYSWYLVALLC